MISHPAPVTIAGSRGVALYFGTSNKTNKTNISSYPTFIHCPLPSLRMSPFFFQMQMM